MLFVIFVRSKGGISSATFALVRVELVPPEAKVQLVPPHKNVLFQALKLTVFN